MISKTKLFIKRLLLLIFAFLVEGGLGFLLINGIVNHDLQESNIIILIIVLMLMIPIALIALLFAMTVKNKSKKTVVKTPQSVTLPENTEATIEEENVIINRNMSIV